ncbi:MAG TPA: MFS transporter [Caldilineaceae bacterium]|nr:MFS transporter [Caldilineaceae bacterium]
MPKWRRTVYVLFAVQLISTVGFSLVFPFLPLYVKEIGIATGGSIEFWAGLVFSSQAVTMMLAAPVWGAFADRYGRKMMLVRATFGGAVLIALMGFAQNAEQLVVIRTLQGLVTGVMAAATALAAAAAPRERTGEALGLLQMARSVGVAVGPVVGGLLGDAFGFRESFWITGGLLALSGLCALLWVHEEFTPAPKATRPGLFDGYRHLLKAPGMGGLYALSLLRSLGQTMILPILALFVVELMGSEEGAASITGLLIGSAAVTGALSAIWLGRLGDRIGHSRIMIGAALAAALCYLPQAFVTSAWQLAAWQALAGFAAGGLVPALSALMNLWAPAGSQGAIYGLDTSVNAAARSVAPMLGAAIAFWAGMRGVFGAAAVIYLLIILLTIHVVRQVRARRGQAEALGLVLKGAGDD